MLDNGHNLNVLPAAQLREGYKLSAKLMTHYGLIVKLRQGSGKDWQGMAPMAKGLNARTLA